MEDRTPHKLGAPLSEEAVTHHLRLNQMLLEFARLFDYGEASDRAIAIVGAAFLDSLLREILLNFLVDDEREVLRLLQPNGPVGSFGARTSMCYCLGLIGRTISSDLRIVARIRNRFAHELGATFEEPKISTLCDALRWHREALCDPPPSAAARDLFQVGVNQLVAHINGLVTGALFEKRHVSNSG